MNTEILSWILNGVMVVAMALIKLTYTNLKDEVKQNKEDIKRLQEEAFKKADFIEFKKELWGRLDRFEDSVNAKLL